jgi:hypothetical protein
MVAKTKPVPNQAFKEILDKIRDNPGAVSSEICILPNCDNPFQPPWEIMIYRPDVEDHPTRYFGACSGDHHEKAVDYYEFTEFMKWKNWKP